MALKKRGKTWHTDFVVDGSRYRMSLETTDWREAQSLEKDRIKEAKEGKLSAKASDIARLTFPEAAERWIEDRAPGRPPLSVRTERERKRAVCKLIGDRKVKSLKPEDVLAYIRARNAEARAPATINRELDVIRGVLKKAHRWHLFAEHVKPVRLVETISGRAMSDDEKTRLLKLASSRKEWENAYYASVLALNTTMRGCEIKGLRWRDVDMLQRIVNVQQSKSKKGVRRIPLNEDAWEAVLALRERAKKMGDPNPDHYLFFSCEHGWLNPKRPQKGWRTAWRRFTRMISCPQCGEAQQPAKTCQNVECGSSIEEIKSSLHGLRFHDLRHHSITELAEGQASDQTIKDIAGHVSDRMLEHYSHIRVEARRAALDALSTKKGQASYGTNRGTNGVKEHENGSEVHAEVIEKKLENMVELVGLEPTTSSLRTMRSPN